VGDVVAFDTPGLTTPVTVKKVSPNYPSRARAAGVGGIVIVSVLVDENGRPSEAKVIKGIVHPLGQECNQAALNAVKQMEWRPGTKDGVRVKVWVSVQVKF
jgi:TonB family protein